jgi:hypothetical protein
LARQGVVGLKKGLGAEIEEQESHRDMSLPSLPKGTREMRRARLWLRIKCE